MARRVSINSITSPEAVQSNRHKNGLLHRVSRPAAAFCAGLALITQPLAAPLSAQAQSAPQRLEDLIPDEALADPEAWARQGDQPDIPSIEDTSPEIDADSPMDAMPLITLEPPEDLELAEIEQVVPGEEVAFQDFADIITPVAEGTEQRISDELVLVFPSDPELFPQRDEFLNRFAALSAVEAMDSGENIARLAAQARSDEDLLRRILRTYGYFDGQVIRSVAPGDVTEEGDPDLASARFEIVPGTRFAVGTVSLGDLSETGSDFEKLRAAYEVFVGDPLSLDAIAKERFDLDEALGESGYPFATVDEPALLVDHSRVEGDVTVPVQPGGKYLFGRVTSNLPDFLSGNHLAEIARFDAGDIYQRSDELDLRRAILATGLVGTVTLTPIETTAPDGEQPGIVDVAVEMAPAPLRSVAGSIGYGTEEGVRVAASWEHRNLFPPEGLLRLRAIAGTQEQLAGVTFRKNNFHGRDRILTVDAFASTLDYTAYDARTLSLVGTYERVSTLLFQKPFSWSLGTELVATQEREADADGNFGVRETYLVAALPMWAQIDSSNDLLNPTQGFRLAARLSPEVSDNNDVQSFYLRSQADASAYLQASDNFVLAGRVRLASIPGAPVDAIAPSRRLYAGGGGSVRGYGYREIGPLNSLGDPTGGRSLVEFSLEARIRTGLMGGAIGVVPFIDAGSVDEDPIPGFGSIKYGAGIGLRYYSSFGPIRVDIAAPINPGPNDAPVAVYVALGQAF